MNEIKYLQQGLVQNEYLQSKMCVSIYIYIYIQAHTDTQNWKTESKMNYTKIIHISMYNAWAYIGIKKQSDVCTYMQKHCEHDSLRMQTDAGIIDSNAKSDTLVCDVI